MVRLPWEKELDETPQGVKTTEEARQFPHRKANRSQPPILLTLQQTQLNDLPSWLLFHK
ncbi:hypothetical protein GCM10010954_14850 [Halobacillus andaensis]|uniref:Uncharacterized protein n=1 Tax=Halobacillus andaensis TaxID=1176239 RepID=A0A917EUB0_HALAA|nr:hypothetical protein GCM10010954_14850 [Halobacillus andaensis]